MKIPEIDKNPKKTGGIEYPRVTTWNVVKEYWKITVNYRWSGSLVFIGMVISTISQSIISPIYYKKFFDLISLNTLDRSSLVSPLISTVFFILAFNIIGWLASRLSMFCTTYFEGHVMRFSRQYAFDYVIEHSYSFFTNNFTGALVQKINRFMRSFERVFDRIVLDIVPLVLKVAGAIIVLFFIKPVIAYGMLMWVVVFSLTSYFFTKYKLKYDIQNSELDSKTSGIISDSISNHNSIQLFTGTYAESARFGEANTKWSQVLMFRWNLQNILETVHTLLSLGIEFFIFYYGIKYWNQGVLTIGTFALVQAYILTIGSSLWGFSRIIRDIYEGVADAKEMVEILHLKHEIQDKEKAPDLEVKKGEIEFKNVGFAFGQNKPVFEGLNISIKPGEKVAFIGSSGAGKSTLVKLLLRLYDISKGQILVDGQNIKDVTQKSLRENISLVPQDPALFHRTLMENIRYGKRDATDEEVMQAAKLAHCHEFINEFPNKYETYVGERGVKLSGGERQRVAIARAILKNAPVLVLDEATSSLDSHSESLIQDALHTLMEGKTTIVIAHRLSTIRKMDRIIVVSKGGVAEEGSHEELIQKTGGIYAKLWSLQAGGFANKSIEELLEV